MKIFSAAQIRDWDQYTIEHEPVASIDLMERAALACVNWISEHCSTENVFHVFCGKGNNGGDGLAIARLLAKKGHAVVVDILEFGHKGTEDFQTNLARLHQYPLAEIRFIQTEENFHAIADDEILIDALFGSGLNRALEGVTARLVDHINGSGNPVISIDIPSGLFTDRSSKNVPAVKATHTLCFQTWKPALLMAENSAVSGEVHLLDIGLHAGFYEATQTPYEIIDKSIIDTIYQPRNRFAHKGNYGHALIVAGSYGKIGAAVLSAKACLRSGAGLVSTHLPRCGYEIMQGAAPEAMVFTDFNSSFNTKIDADLSAFAATGIGPGLGTASETVSLLRGLLSDYRKPIVLDADALNILAAHKDLFALLPPGCILTPHPKEFERLFGATDNEFDRVALAMQKAVELQAVIVLKGHHTLIATPGKGYFNSTGNAGMATGGSGDVLTGILTGLLAQGYQPAAAAILGVYLHGLAGDIASAQYSMEAMIAGDIVECLGAAFQQLHV